MCLDMIIQAQGRKKCFARLLEFVRPSIDPPKRFEGAIDIITQTHGGIASPIWGPLRMVITVGFKTLESLVMILWRVVGLLKRFSNYEKLIKTNSAVQKAIGALYSDVIDFCVRVVEHHSRSSLRAMITSFDKDFRDVSEHINFHFPQCWNWLGSQRSKYRRELESKAAWTGDSIRYVSKNLCLFSTIEAFDGLWPRSSATIMIILCRSSDAFQSKCEIVFNVGSRPRM